MGVDGVDSDPIPELERLAGEATKAAGESAQTPDRIQVIAFFDLSGSTPAKLAQGNAVASRDAYAFTALASAVAQRFGGRVVKTLGDGAFATFNDPVDACRAALNLRHATDEFLELTMTAGLTVGRPLRVELDQDQFDLLGDVVDRAARIQSLAAPGQVLIDSPLYQIVRGEIPSQTTWTTDDIPRRAFAKGIGTVELYELTLREHWHLKNELATPFNVIAEGRPSLAEKLALIRNAKDEIIEIGIGLTSFANYFTGQKPDEFRTPIRGLIRKGVHLKCFALDPAYGPGVAWLNEQGNSDYLQEAEIAKRRLIDESKFYRSNSFLGRLSYFTYSRVPEYWCLGVDVEDPLDGRMFFAPYLMGVARSSTPVIQLSRTSNPELYEKYLLCVRELRAASSEPTR